MALRQHDLGCEKLYMTMTWMTSVCDGSTGVFWRVSLGFSRRRSLDCSVDVLRWMWGCVGCVGVGCVTCGCVGFIG